MPELWFIEAVARLADSDRDIARSRLMGRPKAAAFRALAQECGWLGGTSALPTNAEIAAALGLSYATFVFDDESRLVTVSANRTPSPAAIGDLRAMLSAPRRA